MAVTALAVTLSVAVIFDIPEKISAAAEGTHSHKVCTGSNHTGCTHGNIEFEPFPDIENNGGIILRGKSYYLTKNIVLGENSRIFVEKGVTNLCLNGYSITKANGQIIDINQIDGQSAELNICDCTGNGMIKNTSADDAWDCISVIDDSVLNLYSGTIDGGANGCGISVHRTNGTKGSAANIYGGKVQCTNGIAIYTKDPDTSLNVYSGEISSSDYYTLYIEGERNTLSVYGGTITGSGANPYSTVMIMGDGASADIKGGEVIGENYSALYCHNNSTLRISDGTVKSESTANTCIHNIGTLIVSGGTVSGGGSYGIRNYRSSARATISGGTVSCNGTSVYNYDNGVLEVSGGEITSESNTGMSNSSTLTVSGGTVSGDMALRNYGADAVMTISGGEVSCKGDYGIYNYNGGTLNITDGKVSGGAYCLYNQEGKITIGGGTVSAKSNYALYNLENGTAIINGGTFNSTFSPVINYGTLNITGGSFGAEDPAKTTYIINQKNMALSGSPVFRNAAIWLKTDDNIGITGALAYSAPCLVYVESSLPRTLSSGWSTHMSGKKPSDYFKSPYADAKIIYRDNEAAMVYYYKITYDTNGGSCSVRSAETDISGKLTSLAVPTREGYSFDGWFTEETGGEKITTDTVFTDDTIVYAHWTCVHDWGDTYEKDENQHWQVCTKCGAEGEKSNHTWNDGEETTPPTETTEGVKTYKCTVCKAERTEKIDKISHTHTYSDDWTSDENGHWHAATCGHNTKSDEAEHNFGTPTVTPSTCTQRGSKEYICQTCGYKKTVTLDLAEHSFNGEWQKDVNNHWKVCTVCNTEKSEVTAHSWNTGEITKQPTEDEAGVMLYTCTVCKATKTEPIAPLDHTHDWSGEWSKDDTYHWHDCLNNCGEKKDNAAHIWDDGTVTKQPTADAEGEKTFECTVCGKTKTETLPPKDEPSDPDSGNISVDVQPGENAPETQLKTPFDELVNAVLTSEEQEQIKNGIDIKIILIVSDATASVPADDKAKIEASIRGLSGYKLGQYLDVTMLKKIGEIEQAITNTNAPIRITFEIPTALRGKSEYSVIRVHGSETTILKDLDSDPNTVTIETNKFSTYALTYKEKTSGGGSGGSGGGGSSHHHRYIYDETIIKEPTCTESGEKTLSCSCGQTTTETVPALGHDYRSEITKPATETEDGVRTFTCTRCGDTYTEIIPKTGSESKPSDTSSDTSDNTSSETSDDTSSGVSTSDDTSSDSGDTSSDNSGSSSGGDSSPSGGDNPSTGIAVSLIPLAAILSGVIIISNRRKK